MQDLSGGRVTKSIGSCEGYSHFLEVQTSGKYSPCGLKNHHSRVGFIVDLSEGISNFSEEVLVHGVEALRAIDSYSYYLSIFELFQLEGL